MTKRLSVLSAVLLCSVSGAAMAQQTNGFYVGGAVGGNILEDSKLGGGSGLNERFNPGPVGLGVVGLGLPYGFRTELEAGYRRNDVDKVGGKSASGSVGMITGFGNLLYDFDTGTPFTPHIGGGLGVANIQQTHTRSAGNPTVVGHDTVFAYQLIGGVDYAITPDWKVGLDYHYMETDSARMALEGTTPNAKSSNRFYDHSILLAMRYEFNNPAPAPVVAPPPPPPPPPAAAPQSQRAFQVFFDFDKSTITAAAQSIIDQAAASVKQGNLTRINVTGHTDTVGSAKYNQALSERRAAAVKAALIKDGVPDGEIATRGVGKTDLLVPTGDGVREAQNRRAEIVLQ